MLEIKDVCTLTDDDICRMYGCDATYLYIPVRIETMTKNMQKALLLHVMEDMQKQNKQGSLEIHIKKLEIAIGVDFENAKYNITLCAEFDSDISYLLLPITPDSSTCNEINKQILLPYMLGFKWVDST